MDKLNIAIIGFGRMGITHFSIINSHPKVQITAVADTSSMVLSLLKKYKKNINIYDDFNSLLNNEKLDAIIICTPPSLHYKISLIAADKNINVFSEKPFTTNKLHARELSVLFKNKQLVNQVGYVNRFNDVFTFVKELINEDVIGDIIRFKSELYSRTITKCDDEKTWRDDRENGGGAVYEMASHAIDLVNFLIGKPDKICGSYLSNIYSKNVEDAVISTFLYNNGVSGTLNVNWSDESYRKPTNKIEIFGIKGKILADQFSLKIYLKHENCIKNLRKGWNIINITDIFQPVPFYVRGNEFTTQLYHFIDCITNSISSRCSFEDGAHTLDIIDQIFIDASENKLN